MSKLEGNFYGFYPSLGESTSFNTFNNTNLVTFITDTNGSVLQNGATPTSFIGSFNQNSLDPDVSSFLSVTNLTSSINSTIHLALNQLVFSLKQYGLWNKMVAIYPFIGGTATTHQYNLRNTASFTVSFVNSPTHNALGVTCNGTNQYIDTTLIPSQSLSSPDVHFSIYLNDRTKSGGGLCGSDSPPVPPDVTGPYLLIVPFSNTTLNYNYCAATVYNASANIRNAHVSVTNPNGFSCGSRVQTSITYAQRDRKIDGRTNILDPVNSYRARPSTPIALMARRTSGIYANYINNTIAWSSIGYGLTPSDMLALYEIVQKYQVLLRRAVY